MPIIKRLDDALISKIAAGEVIESPSSVVKELIENAIDSGAKNISIALEDGGKKAISVTDDGCGMYYDDALTSFERHATSKIKDMDDLYSIHTLGFRGEALPSIASVSKTEMVTNPGDIDGTRLLVHFSKFIESKPIGAPKGTKITVSELFSNVPVRKKFLKSESIELGKIIDIVTRYSLLNNQIDFRLSNHSRVILVSPKTDDILSNIMSVYGKEISSNMIKIDNEIDGISISGYVSLPSITRSSKDYQSLFINKRYIKDRMIQDAIYSSYKTLLPKHRHPIFVISIEIDPKIIDVNVHPNKMEIRFVKTREDIISQAVKDSVTQALKNAVLVPSVGFSPTKSVAKNKYELSSSTQAVLDIQEPKVEVEAKNIAVNNIDKSIELNNKINENITDDTKDNAVLSNFPIMKVLGIVNKTYVLASYSGGFYIIDQHAAHERILYEKVIKQLDMEKPKSQNLLETKILEFNAKESEILKFSLSVFQKLGFDIEEFGTNAFAVRAIPAFSNSKDVSNLVHDILGELIDSGKIKSILESKERIARSVACRSAIKGGDEVTLPYLDKMLQDLSKADNPYTCPHGRPTLIEMTVSELERKFKRVV
ncbi:MAG: DNA mismatch repair endonuclease MutL [DPANN group archaeon]|nr:DNA mismatch repair endonuclease MutL [DPANN group archaeon]